MSSLCNITNSIKGIEQSLDKLDIISNRVDELVKQFTRKMIQINQLKTFYVKNLTNKKNSKNYSTKIYKKENNLLNKMIKQLDNNLEIEKTKKNALEQYGWWAMLEVTGIPHKDGENCIDIIYKICELTSRNKKKSKIEIEKNAIKERSIKDWLQKCSTHLHK